MKRFPTLTIVIAFTMFISACGAEPVPTVNPVDVQNTAIAAAFTMVAETQAAIPTNTPLPPTETFTPIPSPTNTSVVSPTALVAAISSPTTAPASGAPASSDPCGLTKVLAPKHGKETIIRIWNTTKTPISVSIFLNPTEAHQECGYRQYNLAKNADVVITDLVYGCYNVWAWNTSGKPNFNSSGYGCINNPDKWTFVVNTATVNLAGP